MPDRYVGTGGAWKPVRAAYVGVDGAWRPQRVRLVAHDGRWLETNTSEIEDHPWLGITGLSYRAGGPLQGALEVWGYGLSNLLPQEPRTGAFFSMRATFGDLFENFSSLDPHGTEFPLPAVEDGVQCYRLDPSKTQYLSTNVSEDGRYDLLGFLVGGVDPEQCLWESLGKFKPRTMPTGDDVVILWYGAVDAERFIRLWYDAGGTLRFRYRYSASEAYDLSIAAAAILDQWTGFSFRHWKDPSTSTRYMTLLLHDGRETSIAGMHSTPDGLCFNYLFPSTDDIPIEIGSGLRDPSTVPSTDWFRSANTSAAFTIGGAHGEGLYWTGTAYRSAIPSKAMAPNTGKYYIEILNHTSYDVHYGLTDSNTWSLTGDNILYSWVINTINGRIWNHATGGGTNWTSAIPDNAVIGLVYDSDDGTLELFVNGTSRGKPFASGAIIVPAQFTISGRGQNATGPVRPFEITCRTKSTDWTNKPAGTYQEMPYQDEAVPGTRVYGDVALRDFGFRRDNNGVMDPARRALIIDPDVSVDFTFTPESGGDPVDVNKYILVQPPAGDHVVMAVPEVPNGNYVLSASYSTGGGPCRPRLFTVREQVARQTPLHIDFAADPVSTIRQALMAGHKQWGGLNGGISADNIVLNRQTGLAELTACGDLYSGPVLGTDRFGKPSGFNTRIGACLVTRDYFGPGRYRVVMQPLQAEGACNALWGFHYEESYPGSDLWTSHVVDGLHYGGTEELGFYTVRNHEIDIEFPTALKTDADQEDVAFTHARFNTWQGELRNWAVPNNDVPTHDPMYSPVNDPSYWSEYTDDFTNHGVNLADGNFHELGYDWHLGDNPRVEFYIDGVLRHTVTTHIPDIPGRFWIGHWFPSAAVHWAGRGSNWNTQTMLVKSISITPFADEQSDARNVVETYPNDVYRDLKHII